MRKRTIITCVVVGGMLKDYLDSAVCKYAKKLVEEVPLSDLQKKLDDGVSIFDLTFKERVVYGLKRADKSKNLKKAWEAKVPLARQKKTVVLPIEHLGEERALDILLRADPDWLESFVRGAKSLTFNFGADGFRLFSPKQAELFQTFNEHSLAGEKPAEFQKRMRGEE